MENTTALLLSWNITCLHISSVFPNACSGTDTLFLAFWVEKLHRDGLFLDDISIWVPLHFQIFSAHLFDKRPLITITHCHLHHTAVLINQHSQKTDANEQLANKVARSNVDL